MVLNMNKHLSRIASCLTLCLPLLSQGQESSRADPASANAPAPALGYFSAFADYKPWHEVKPANWRAVNDNVLNASVKGEHSSHKSMAAPSAASAPNAPASKASAPPMHGHRGHSMHGGKR